MILGLMLILYIIYHIFDERLSIDYILILIAGAMLEMFTFDSIFWYFLGK